MQATSKIFITCVNSLCTQLKANSQLRMILFAIIGTSQNAETFEIALSDIQRLLSVNIRDKPMQVDYITEQQLLKLLEEFSRFQAKAGVQLISSNYNPYEKIFSFSLPVLAIANEIISNAKTDSCYDENPVRAIICATQEFVSELGILRNIPRGRKITTKTLFSRLNNVGKTLNKLVELAVDEGLSIDEIKASLADFGASVVSVITSKCEELDKLQKHEALVQSANIKAATEAININAMNSNFTDNRLATELITSEIPENINSEYIASETISDIFNSEIQTTELASSEKPQILIPASINSYFGSSEHFSNKQDFGTILAITNESKLNDHIYH